MPLNISAIYANTSPSDYSVGVWLSVTGATAGNVLAGNSYPGGSAGLVTGGYSSAISSGTALVPVEVYFGNYSVNVTTAFAGANPNYFRVEDITSGVTAGAVGSSAATFNDRGSWVVSQGSTGNITITCTSLGSSSTCPVFIALANNVSTTIDYPPEIWEVSVLDRESNVIATKNVRPPLGGGLPQTSFLSTIITQTDSYFAKITRRIAQENAQNIENITVLIPTTLTAPTVTSGGSSNMFSWLDNSYWYLTDLQVNLGTRAVTNRQGSINLRPSDTINFAILFHDGTAGINPQATDIKLAVRSSNNTSPYHFWSAATVSTVTVSGDVYYAITVTASDDDLLTAQAANLLAGSNASQSLLGEIQWTTTRGTFSSDTFTINVPSEVVREPDV